MGRYGHYLWLERGKFFLNGLEQLEKNLLLMAWQGQGKNTFFIRDKKIYVLFLSCHMPETGNQQNGKPCATNKLSWLTLSHWVPSVLWSIEKREEAGGGQSFFTGRWWISRFHTAPSREKCICLPSMWFFLYLINNNYKLFYLII